MTEDRFDIYEVMLAAEKAMAEGDVLRYGTEIALRAAAAAKAVIDMLDDFEEADWWRIDVIQGIAERAYELEFGRLMCMGREEWE